MNIPVLYSFRRCPYAMRARMAVAASGNAVELREVHLKNVPAAMRAVSPKATVPVLVLPGGGVIDESMEVIYWVLAQRDPERWIDNNSQAECDRLVAENDGDFKAYLDRYKYFERFPEHPQSRYRSCADPFLAQLDRLLDTQAFLCADRITVADVAIFPFIRQFSMVDQDYFDSLPYSALQSWLRYFLEHDLFAVVMNKYPVWQQGSSGVYFPQLSNSDQRAG